ncbi:MAG: hypothetical protein ACERLM_14490 [Acidimicrobiales bacterium]
MDVTEGPTMDVTPREAPPVAPKRRALGWGLGFTVLGLGFIVS